MFKRFRELREDRDLTQSQVAAYLNLSQTGYSKYETGENEIPIKSLVQLSILYGTSVDYLLGLTDVIEPYKRGSR